MTTPAPSSTGLEPGQTCPGPAGDPGHDLCPHPEGATLYLGGNAWAHPKDRGQLLPLDAVHPYPGNPRRGDQPAITASIRDFGFYGLITAQASTAHIVVGNHRWRGLQELGGVLAPVELLALSDARASSLVARDNRTSDLGVYDDAELLALLRSDEDVLALSGYADAPEELLLMQRRVEAEDVFTVGVDHMLDEFREIAGEDPTDYAARFARKVTVYIRDEAAILDFKDKLGIETDVGAWLGYPIGWAPAIHGRAGTDEQPAEEPTGE